MNRLLFQYHLIVVVLLAAAGISFYLFTIDVLAPVPALVVCLVFMLSMVSTYLYVVPYLYYKRVLLKTAAAFGSQHPKYHGNSLKLVSDLKKQGIQLYNARQVNIFMPSLVISNPNETIVVSFRTLVQTYRSVISFYKYLLRAEIVIEIHQPLNVNDSHHVYVEKRAEVHPDNSMEGQLQAHFSQGGLAKDGYVEIKPERFVVIFQGLCKKEQSVVEWISGAKQFLSAHHLN
jgi:hypothetical protein